MLEDLECFTKQLYSDGLSFTVTTYGKTLENSLVTHIKFYQILSMVKAFKLKNDSCKQKENVKTRE